jgi:hypothetical protein
MSNEDKEVVYHLDLEEFKEATDEQRREMLKRLLGSIKRRGSEETDVSPIA